MEVGTHQELLDKGGYYYGLVKSQVGQDEEEKRNKDKDMAKKESLKSLSQHQSKINYKDVQIAHDKILEKEGVSHGEMFK